MYTHIFHVFIFYKYRDIIETRKETERKVEQGRNHKELKDERLILTTLFT